MILFINEEQFYASGEAKWTKEIKWNWIWSITWKIRNLVFAREIVKLKKRGNENKSFTGFYVKTRKFMLILLILRKKVRIRKKVNGKYWIVVNNYGENLSLKSNDSEYF